MARGWESKSVESQIEDGHGSRGERRQLPGREEIERTHRREELELSRRRISGELERARTTVHRTALENALRHLEDEIRKFD